MFVSVTVNIHIKVFIFKWQYIMYSKIYPYIPFRSLHTRNRDIIIRGILKNSVVECYGRALNFTTVLYATSA